MIFQNEGINKILLYFNILFRIFISLMPNSHYNLAKKKIVIIDFTWFVLFHKTTLIC